MRVLHVSQEFPPETAWGGIGTYVGLLAPALVEAGSEVHVLSVVRGQEASVDVTDDGVVVHREPLRRPPGLGRVTRMSEAWGRVSLAWAVARATRRLVASGLHFDVVESPEWNAEALFLARRRRLPTVVRLHSWASQVFPYLDARGRDARAAARLEEELVGRADVVIGTTSQLLDASRRLGLELAATSDIPLPVAPKAEVMPTPSRRIVFVGRLEARKGPETLVRALPKVLRHAPGTTLVIAGRDSSAPGIPSYATWLTEIARDLGVAEHVEIQAEQLSRQAVDDLQASAAVCAVPSRWESFGYTAAEALAAGRPVVASNAGGLPAVVDDGETGYLIESDDACGWAAALSGLLTDPARAVVMGARGAQRMRQRFHPSLIAERTLGAYDTAVRRFADAHSEDLVPS